MNCPAQAFGEAVEYVLRHMLGEEASWRVSDTDASESGVSTDLVSTMELRTSFGGWARVACDVPTAREILDRLLGFPEDEVTKTELSDGLAELLNVIAGAAKARLAGTSYHFRLSIPQTEWLKDAVKPYQTAESEVTHILVEFACGRFVLSFSLNPPDADEAAG